ncbi:ribbon-helix-helix domain-containing protein [Hymenobacter ruricola]|uniref:Uncharacterized protein n=1 Tax=Hymenobacter ruricola TaxID=2791023 RepID=A0ABS0I9Z1_9BACT|nr:hypothetical protein [Hymenobacter ruricola]MBF9223771.1 hypothetical protein [Hymenobacter ruricola]
MKEVTSTVFPAAVQPNAHPVAHFITQIKGVNEDQEPLEVEIIIRRKSVPAPTIDKEEMLLPKSGRKSSPYIHSFTTNFSEANKRGLDNLSYWSTGRRRSKTFLINQALEQYLVKFKESQHDIPHEDA